MKVVLNRNLKLGFTLIELLVVVAIIGILASVVLAYLSGARDKGVDGAIKGDLGSARSQAEVFYNVNNANPNTYIGMCAPGIVGGVAAIGSYVFVAAKAYGLSTYTQNGTGTTSTATCNENGTSWAAEVPLRAGDMWCVDSSGKAKTESGSIGAGTTCS